MARAHAGERGAALLFVMVAVAVLTALAVDLAYDTRVGLRIAANARDDLRATAAAKGGVALARLVLSFQQQIDAVGQTGGGQRVPGQPALQGVPSFPRPQLWRLVPVGQALADGLFGGPGAAAGAEGGPTPPGGGFEVKIEDEGRKVNAHLDASYTTGLLGSDVQALYQLVCDPRWDALFDREDGNGLRVSRQDLLIHLRDWRDENEVSSALAAAIPPGTCAVVTGPGQSPFEDGFGDENFPYDRGEDRYRAKNARMDSLAELHLVAGVTDAFMAAFGDALTVHLPPDALRSANALEPRELVQNAMLAADTLDQAAFHDLEFPARLQQAVLERTFLGNVSMTGADFVDVVRNLGVSVKPDAEKLFTDRASTFRLRSVGRAGDVAKTLDVVLRLPTQPGLPVSIPGRILHWREE